MRVIITVQIVVGELDVDGDRVASTASPGSKGDVQWSDSMDRTKIESVEGGESSLSTPEDPEVDEFLSALRMKPMRSRSSARPATKRALAQSK